MDTAGDDTCMLAAILDGAFETPPWRRFLDGLRLRTSADNATLIFRPPGGPLSEALHLYSGVIERGVVDKIYSEYLPTLELLSDFRLDEGRAYSFGEVYPPRNPQHLRFYREVVVPSGVTSARLIRVLEPSGIDAWLTISRTGEDFTRADTLLLERLAVPLRGALRFHVALARERFSATVTGDALRRLHFGWIVLSGNGQVLDNDAQAAAALRQSSVLAIGPDRRLVVWPGALKKQVYAALDELARDHRAQPQAVTLNQDPWLDMLLVPSSRGFLSEAPPSSVIAYVHGDSWRSADRCAQLAQLFALTPSEARLALALSRGFTIPEAAEELGLKIQTVRSYSKLVYAKTGARGAADLVRIVMRSVLALAPDQ